MKKILIHSIVICIPFLIGQGCSDEGSTIPPCDPAVINGGEFYSNLTGVLIYTDSIYRKLPDSDYYIIPVDNNPKNLLLLCNLPDAEYNLNKGDQINVLFSGNLQVVPPNGDVIVFAFELTKIEELNPTE